jgi:hypothetical protein
LHGHDFAILDQSPWKLNRTWERPLHVGNPARRDVVLLPSGGYVVIAFKTDNPGAWLVHCHIARHAGEGLAMQIMERQKSAAMIWPSATSPALNVTKEGCRKWNQWWNDCKNWWMPSGQEGQGCSLNPIVASPDSGI